MVGANGTGKSTLLDVLAGRRAPTTGTVERGPTVVVGYYDQHGHELDPEHRVQDVVAGPHRTPGSLADVALMKRFWFTGTLPFTRVGNLSGGERRRLQLLAVLAAQPNVLLLDEPTNDLDLDTLRILEDFLEDWPGTLVVVSHDRAFLDRTIDTVLAIGPDGVAPVPGGLDAWLAGLLAPPVRCGAVAGAVAGAREAPPVRRRASGPPVAGPRQGAGPAGPSAGEAARCAGRHHRPPRAGPAGVRAPRRPVRARRGRGAVAGPGRTGRGIGRSINRTSVYRFE